MYLWGEGGRGGQERSKNQYIFTESSCVAGTQTGRKGAGQRKGKGFRVRKAVGKERTEGKSFFYVSTRYLTTQKNVILVSALDWSIFAVVLRSEA